MYLAPNATPSQAPSVWCTYISRFLVLFPPEQVAIDYAQERTHKGTLKELNISKLETEHQPSLTARIMGCCSITLIEARSGTRAVLNGYSAVAFLSCGRREDFLFGEKKRDTVQRLWGCQGHLDNEALQVQWSHVSGAEWPWKINQKCFWWQTRLCQLGKEKRGWGKIGVAAKKTLLLLASAQYGFQWSPDVGKGSSPRELCLEARTREANAIVLTTATHLVSVFPLWDHL